MKEINAVLRDLKQRNFKKVYLLMGEETYYIDKISEYIAQNALTEDERAFNQVVLYGRDIEVDQIISESKRFPMMAEHQVVIIKEAQELNRSIYNLDSFIPQLQESTILVLCYKYKSIDKRKALYKNIKKEGVVIESKPLYEDKVPGWIIEEVARRGYHIEPKSAMLLAEFLGTSLGKINNELDKLCLILPEGSLITPAIIEENIGISKDFNSFELQKALINRDQKTAFRIINYYAQNSKEHPILKTIPVLYNFFSKLLLFHGLKNKSSRNEVASALGISPFFVKDFTLGAQAYSMKSVSAIVASLRELDLKAKGVGAQNLPAAELYKELLIKLRA